ncbi:MAG: hypothetical protein ACTHLO_00130 [Pseudolabrys sp.]
MMAMKPERTGSTDVAPESQGPDKPGPAAAAERRIVDKLGAINEAAANAFEGEIREFVRRDVAPRRPREDAPPDAPIADNLNGLIRRVSGASMEEIDRVINELQTVREMLRREGERVSREVAGYASLSHAAMTAMKVIGESVQQWKSAPRNDHRPPV